MRLLARELETNHRKRASKSGPLCMYKRQSAIHLQWPSADERRDYDPIVLYHGQLMFLVIIVSDKPVFELSVVCPIQL